jgi:hypothetical protein
MAGVPPGDWLERLRSRGGVRNKPANDALVASRANGFERLKSLVAGTVGALALEVRF